MNRALVLSGGGSRGAYECGAWQALRELNVRLDGVYGTSIGALNAALVAQGDLDAALDLWNNISIRQIVAVDEDEDFSVDTMLSRKRDIIPFLLENAHQMRDFFQGIDGNPFDYTYEEAPGAHTWEFWDEHIQHFLRFLGLTHQHGIRN